MHHDEDLALAVGSAVPILIAAQTQQERNELARAIHRHGRRPTGPFVSIVFDTGAGAFRAVDDAARPEASGPVATWTAQAAGGTLYVDDIGALTTEYQHQLLGVLDHRLTDTGHDVRLIVGAGTNWGARERASQGFSERLYFRLNTLRIECQPTQVSMNREVSLDGHTVCSSAAS